MLAELLLASSLVVLDGDTLRLADGQTVRISNIDAPETGGRAKCDAERMLGEVAKRRLGELLSTGEPTLITEGRPEDKYGRKLARVTVNGRDVGSILISEGLAREWKGKREPWCL